MRRRHIEYACIFLVLLDIKSIIFKYNHALCKTCVVEADGLARSDERAQNIEQCLRTCANHDVFRAADGVSLICDIAADHLAQLILPLRLAVGQHASVLPQRALDIAPPQIKVKAVRIDIVWGKIIEDFWFLCCVCRCVWRALVINICCCTVGDVISALRSGNNIAIRCKAQIGSLDGRAAQTQLHRAAPDGGHLRARH